MGTGGLYSVLQMGDVVSSFLVPHTTGVLSGVRPHLSLFGPARIGLERSSAHSSPSVVLRVVGLRTANNNGIGALEFDFNRHIINDHANPKRNQL
jgi:hypothetical protein